MTAETATGISTWDATPPRRPGLGDVNGAAMRFRGEGPFDPRRVPMGNDQNGRALMLLGYAQVVRSGRQTLSFSVFHNDGGHATIAGATPGSTAPTINLMRTPGGAGSGDLFLWWAANAFPPHTVRPRARINSNVPGCICADWYTDIGSGHSGIRVVTQAPGGAPTDMTFTVDIE